MSLANKVVVITGASSGIGAATARTFAGLSARVVLVGRNKDNLQSVANDCKKNGAKILEIVADVSKDQDVKRIVEETVKAFKGIDILVNNAGFGGNQKIEDGVNMFDNIMATNLRGVFLLTSLATPHLAASKGNIVNVSSIAAFRPVLGLSAYCISKAGLDMLTRCSALELAEYGIRVNSVNPGATKSAFLQVLGVSNEKSEEMFERAAIITPLKQVAEAQDVANTIAYLATDQARCITGSIVTIDNGQMLTSPSLMDKNI